MARRTPYTARGIRRVQCWRAGCRNYAVHQWQICADGRVYRPVCLACDIEMNRMILKWAGDPDADKKLAAYEAREIEAEYGYDER